MKKKMTVYQVIYRSGNKKMEVLYKSFSDAKKIADEHGGTMTPIDVF